MTDLTDQLIAIAEKHAPWHSNGGWFCDQCDADCGDTPPDLCSCCLSAFNADEVTG